MHKRPAPLPALLFGGALVFGAFLFLRPSALWICGSVMLMAAGWAACRRKRVTIFAAGLCIGLIVGYIHRPGALDRAVFDGQVRVWTGEVERVSQRAGSQSCVVRLANGAQANVILSSLTPEVRAHDEIEFRGAAQPADLFEEAGIGEVSTRTSADRRTVATIFVEPLKYRVTGHCTHPTDKLAALADDLSRYIYSSGLDPEAAALLCSAWLGRDDISPDFNWSVRALGLSHLLCVSGMHVGLVALVISMLIYPLSYFRRRAYIRYCVIIILVWLYVALTGLQPSAFRAAVMITAFYIVEYLQFSRNTLNTLCLAASVVIIFNPWWIFAVGFQLSVMAVAGIVVLVPFLNPFTGTHQGKLANIANAVALPVAVTITTFPVVLYSFHSISPVSIPTNILAALVFPVFMFGGIIAVMLLHGGVGFAAVPVDAFADLLRRACDVGGTVADGLYLSDGRLIMMLGLVGGIMAMVRYGRWHLRPLCVGISVVMMIVLAVLPYPHKRELVVYSNGRHATVLISGQRVPLYVSTMTRPRPTLPYRRYFGLRGYDPERLTLLPPGYSAGEISLRDSVLITPRGDIDLNRLRKQPSGTIITY